MPLDDDDLPEQGTKRILRVRKKAVNYAIPPPLEEMPPPPPKQTSRPKPSRGNTRKGSGWSANGTVLSRYMGMSVPDDTDSDGPIKTPTKGFGARAGARGGSLLEEEGRVQTRWHPQEHHRTWARLRPSQRWRMQTHWM